MTARYGCRTTAELVARVTRLSGRSAIEAVRVGRAVSIPCAAVSGAPLTAADPAMRSAIPDNVIGVDGVAAIAVVLDEATTTREHRLAAGAELDASAQGEGHDTGPRPPATTASCKHASGPFTSIPTAPNPETNSRSGIVGSVSADPTDGLVPITVTCSGEMPTLGGAAPTLIVSVGAEVLAAGTGARHVDGIDEPAPLAVVRHVGIYKVTVEKSGEPKALEVLDPTINVHHRRVITLRDGGCIIPGCQVPAAWREIHHVVAHTAASSRQARTPLTATLGGERGARARPGSVVGAGAADD